MSNEPNGLLVPRCRKCGKWATARCIDGDWWPPCGCGIAYLKYSDEPDDTNQREARKAANA
jgi:hypothetical protein